MALSYELISQFAKLAASDKKTTSEATVYGTIKVDAYGNKYVKLDGSDQLTPLADENRPTADTTIADAKVDERVSVLIKDHTATVTGNMSSPAARTEDVETVATQVAEFEVVTAHNITTDDIIATNGMIDNLVAITGKYTELDAVTAEIGSLKADLIEGKKLKVDEIDALIARIEHIESECGKFTEIETEDLEALNAEITNLKGYTADFTYISAVQADVNNLNADYANFKKASIEDLEAQNAKIEKLVADKAEVKDLVATNAEITNLKAKDAEIEDLVADKADVKDLEATNANIKNLGTKYANIDFANIGEAAIKKIFSDTGLIKDLVVGDSTVTGELVGVTIKGDLIEGNTVKADRLVVRGSDGIYYKLNFEAGAFTEGETVPDDSLHGSVITAKSITAEKVSVKDLVAFGATIGGFNISQNSLYSGVKSAVDNTTQGIYMDSEGQMAIGDNNNFIKYYKDAEGNYKLAVSASSILFSTSSKSVEEVVNEAVDTANTAKETADKAVLEATVSLRIDSSRGTVFKNNTVNTVLSAVIYKGSKRITDIDALHVEFGSGAYLEWLWQRMGEETFGTILSTDSRIGNGGFTFTLSPEDVDTKVVFMCQLITD